MEEQQPRRRVVIVGCGPAGSLMAVYMAKRGWQVDIYERRTDIRNEEVVEGRSINLALSARGLAALDKAGLSHLGKELGIPMHGRIIHPQAVHPTLEFQQYGVRKEQHLLSVSRTQLNERLMTAAEEFPIVKFHFQHRCTGIDYKKKSVMFVDESEKDNPKNVTVEGADLIVGADGAFSAVRGRLQRSSRFDFSQMYIDHAYKELTMPPDGENYRMSADGLHIWPRGDFMMIALPNLDKTFTVTLFMPWKNFKKLKTKEQVRGFFEKYFPDAIPLMPNIEDQFFANPTAPLINVKCRPLHKDNSVLIGDAAHAIVPFYGQGMNAALEDVRVFDEVLFEHHNGDLDEALRSFSRVRKPDVDAISDLSHRNYLEMRDHVTHTDYLIRKKVDSFLHFVLGDSWIPLYSMVSFTTIPYAEVIRRAQAQDRIINRAKYAVPLALVAAASLAFICFPNTFKDLASKWSARL